MKNLLTIALLLLSNLAYSQSSKESFDSYVADPNSYCLKKSVESSEGYKNRLDRLVVTGASATLKETLTNPVNPSIASIAANVAFNFGIKEVLSFWGRGALDSGEYLLSPLNNKHFGSVIVTHSFNTMGSGFSSKRLHYFTGNQAYYSTFSGFKLGGCIPSADVFRSLGLQFEAAWVSTNSSIATTSGLIYAVSPKVAVLAGFQDANWLMFYNVYLPPGGPYIFWDVERGVMPRFLSLADKDNPNPMENRSQFDWHEKTGKPISRPLEPADFEGFAPGGYELHLWLKDRMTRASEEYTKGVPPNDIFAGVKRDFIEYRKTLPPIPEGFTLPESKHTADNYYLGPEDKRVSSNIDIVTEKKKRGWFW